MIDPASEAVINARRVVYRLATELESKALWVESEADHMMWECVSLLCSIGPSLEIAEGLLSTGAESADQYVGSVLDCAVMGRGLLYHSIALGIRLGVVDNDDEVQAYKDFLDMRIVKPVEIIVAYLDYLGATDEIDADFFETMATLGRDLAEGLPSSKWRCHYWTSSDSYSLFGILNTDGRDAEIAAFVQDLVWLQHNIRAKASHVGWRWQVGVTVAEATVLGDIMIPSREAARAATLMKKAKLPHYGGGLILVDATLVTKTGFTSFHELLVGGTAAQSVQLTFRENVAKGVNAYELSTPPPGTDIQPSVEPLVGGAAPLADAIPVTDPPKLL